jgi:hypothetical protein
MDLEDYKIQVASRYKNLSEDERQLLLALGGTPTGEVLNQVLGPELSEMSLDSNVTQQETVLQEQMPPARRGLGARPQ